jgi:hypothetical protein
VLCCAVQAQRKQRSKLGCTSAQYVVPYQIIWGWALDFAVIYISVVVHRIAHILRVKILNIAIFLGCTQARGHHQYQYVWLPVVSNVVELVGQVLPCHTGNCSEGECVIFTWVESRHMVVLRMVHRYHQLFLAAILTMADCAGVQIYEFWVAFHLLHVVLVEPTFPPATQLGARRWQSKGPLWFGKGWSHNSITAFKEVSLLQFMTS